MATKYPQFRESEEGRESMSICEEKDELVPHYRQQPPKRTWSYSLCILSLLLIVSLAINILGLLWREKRDLDSVCSLYTSQNPSPISQDVKITYATKRFTASFLKRSPYTEEPSQAVDDAWLALGTRARHYQFPEDLAAQFNIVTGYAKYDPEQGGGYPVLFEFEHHLHCVNLLRQALFWNYEYYSAQGNGAFKNEPKVLKQHVSHCVDTLRQVIMCQPDTGVFGQYWISDIGATFVDFQTEHKCKNFEELRDWVVSNQVSEEFYNASRVVRRPGDIVMDRVP